MALRRQLEEPESRRILSDVRFIDALIEQKRLSLTGLVTNLAELMPEEVKLSALALAPDSHGLAIRFVITGKSDEAVEHFLSNLEESPHFTDVAIVNEGFEESGANAELENIACTAHYVVGSDEASEQSGD